MLGTFVLSKFWGGFVEAQEWILHTLSFRYSSFPQPDPASCEVRAGGMRSAPAWKLLQAHQCWTIHFASQQPVMCSSFQASGWAYTNLLRVVELNCLCAQRFPLPLERSVFQNLPKPLQFFVKIRAFKNSSAGHPGRETLEIMNSFQNFDFNV